MGWLSWGGRALASATAIGLTAPAVAAADHGASPMKDAIVAPSSVKVARHARTPAGDPRYALVHGCFAMRSVATGRFVARDGDGGWSATTADPAAAEGFRMQATTLGRYLLYSRQRDFVAAGTDGRAVVAKEPSEAADFELLGGDPYTLTSAAGPSLAAGDGGALRTVTGTPEGDATRFAFVPAQGCADYPEVELSVTGQPSKGPTPYSEVRGYADAHMHMMAFEFLGGRAHCGRPWHPYGAPYALTDCPDHYTAEGNAALLENVVSTGSPVGSHDPVGWPTFKDWPAPHSLTHEQSYYRWLERSWMAGQRLFVNLFVDNEALCNVYPYKKNPCDDMATVRLEHQRIHELQDYIDAQAGGPGKGFFRIVTDPFQARKVMNDGKLAVVLGIEVSRLFHCGLQNGVPQCTKDSIDRDLAGAYEMGVRDLELVNKFDNGLGGVAGDAGALGLAINGANFTTTGSFWRMQTCDEADKDVHDRDQATAVPNGEQDQIFGAGFSKLLPAGAAPVYPSAPHCNAMGLTEMGRHLVQRMMQRGMLIDPDHLSVKARRDLLAETEAAGYPGVVSSHSWSTPDAYPRILKAGGFVAPYAGDSKSFVEEWRKMRAARDDRWTFGIGYGADANGFGAQGDPRPDAAKNPVTYPFKALDPAVTVQQQRSGERVYDINKDGVAHYGLYPDWIEDLRKQAGDQIVEDVARGAEAYLQTWERAVGISPTICRSPRLRFTRAGLGVLRLGVPAEEQLRGAGQPSSRTGRVWSWCVNGREGVGKQVRVVYDRAGRVGAIVSTARRHRIGGLGPGMKASRVHGGKRLPGGILVKGAGKGRRYAFVVRRGRIAATAVLTGRASRTTGRLREHLRLAKVIAAR